MIVDTDKFETKDNRKPSTYRVIANPSNGGYLLLAIREQASPTARIVTYAKADEELLVSHKQPKVQVHESGTAYTRVTNGWARTDFVIVEEE